MLSKPPHFIAIGGLVSRIKSSCTNQATQMFPLLEVDFERRPAQITLSAYESPHRQQTCPIACQRPNHPSEEGDQDESYFQRSDSLQRLF